MNIKFSAGEGAEVHGPKTELEVLQEKERKRKDQNAKDSKT